MKTTLLFLSVFLSANLFGQNVNIPDANFKAYLVENPEINTNGDTEIQVSEANSFNGAIDCEGLNISDLTGVETFSALTELYCVGNQLTSLDVSQNTALSYLECFGNQLTSLDVSQNTALVEFGCSYNELTCLDVSNGNNINVFTFYAVGNPNLTCIEVDDAEYSSDDFYWTAGIDTQMYFSEDCNYPENCDDSSVGLTEMTTSKNLIQILDLMGRETSFKPNTPLIYVYDDGSIEKVFSVEY